MTKTCLWAFQTQQGLLHQNLACLDQGPTALVLNTVWSPVRRNWGGMFYFPTTVPPKEGPHMQGKARYVWRETFTKGIYRHYDQGLERCRCLLHGNGCGRWTSLWFQEERTSCIFLPIQLMPRSLPWKENLGKACSELMRTVWFTPSRKQLTETMGSKNNPKDLHALCMATLRKWWAPWNSQLLRKC